jgi:hypothetical protein
VGWGLLINNTPAAPSITVGERCWMVERMKKKRIEKRENKRNETSRAKSRHFSLLFSLSFCVVFSSSSSILLLFFAFFPQSIIECTLSGGGL